MSLLKIITYILFIFIFYLYLYLETFKYKYFKIWDRLVHALEMEPKYHQIEKEILYLNLQYSTTKPNAPFSCRKP